MVRKINKNSLVALLVFVSLLDACKNDSIADVITDSLRQIQIMFSYVQVSAALDALSDMAAGRINIHVLMALAAFASAFMGNPLEGGLLLAMFNMAHIGNQTVQSHEEVFVIGRPRV